MKNKVSQLGFLAGMIVQYTRIYGNYIDGKIIRLDCDRPRPRGIAVSTW